MKYKDWTLIDWDGNASLGLKCWRKSFGRGHVSVGAGEFLTVVYSFGPDSERSFSSTRWDYDRLPISEEDMMEQVDRCRGYSPHDAFRRGYIGEGLFNRYTRKTSCHKNANSG